MSINTLPRYVALGSYDEFYTYTTYLNYVGEGVPGTTRHGYIQLGSNVIVSPFTKFEFEAAASTHKSGGGPQLVHIKSCYNNKYWARVSSSSGVGNGDDHWLAACADAPDEDTSKWTCTLFQLSFSGVSPNLRIQIRHVQTNNLASPRRLFQPNGIVCLILAKNPTSISDTWYHIFDWESLSILPSRVYFKLVERGVYLDAHLHRRRNYIIPRGRDTGRKSISHQAINAPDGSVQIKSDFFGLFWRSDDRNVIMADVADDQSSNIKRKDSLFRPLKTGDDAVAIPHSEMTPWRFVGADEYDYTTWPSPRKYTIVKVEDAVVGDRLIYNVHYHLSQARIYDEEPLVVVSAAASNASTEPETLSVTLSRTVETTRSFNHSVSVTSSVNTAIQTGFLKIFEGKIEISATGSYQHSWGKTMTTSETVRHHETVTVPPGTRAKVRLLATKASYHVPFSYTIRDLPTSLGGRAEYTNKDDGLYIGANPHTFRSETTYEPLEFVQ